MSEYSAKAREFIGREIRRLMHRGYSHEQAIAVAHETARRKGMTVPEKPNPLLALVNPPPGSLQMATAVYEVAYRHARDGERYRHTFERPGEVELWVIDSRRVLIFGRERAIIQMFGD